MLYTLAQLLISNDTVSWLTLLHRPKRISGSNLGAETGYVHLRLLVVPPCPYGQTVGHREYFKIYHDGFRALPVIPSTLCCRLRQVRLGYTD
jgi:hypothetical protein